MYMAAAVYVAGYVLTLCAQNPYYLYFGRFFCGLASGLTSVSCPTYVAEIASPHVRGLLGSGFQVSFIGRNIQMQLSFIKKGVSSFMHYYHKL